MGAFERNKNLSPVTSNSSSPESRDGTNMEQIQMKKSQHKMNGRKGDVTSDGSFRAKQQKPHPVTSNHHSRNLKFRQPRKQIWNKFRTNPDDKKFQPKFRDLGIATTLESQETGFVF